MCASAFTNKNEMFFYLKGLRLPVKLLIFLIRHRDEIITFQHFFIQGLTRNMGYCNRARRNKDKHNIIDRAIYP